MTDKIIKTISFDGGSTRYVIEDELARTSIGTLTDLTTESKSDLVSALNELNAKSIIVDTELNETSPNPIQNAAITTALDLKQDLLTAGTGISISDEGIISNTQTSAEWGNIQGELSEQSDLIELIDSKQDTLTAGAGISISDEGVISNISGNYIYKEDCPALTSTNGICTWVVNHNLGTTDIICSLYAGDVEITKGITINSSNQITVTFESSVNVSAGEYTIVIATSGGTLIQHRNCNVVLQGNINTTDGILSNFSSSNYAELPFILNTENPWELGLKFKVPEGHSGVRLADSIYGIACGFSLFIGPENKLWIVISSNGSSWNIIPANTSLTSIITPNIFHWIKIRFTGTQYLVDYSSDGKNFTTELTFNSTSKMKSTKPVSLGFGSNSNPLTNGEIDLNECYIKMDGNEVWRGTTVSNTLKVQEVKQIETKRSNVIVHGHLNDNNHVLSGFYVDDNTLNYVSLPEPITLGNDFEIGLKFELSSLDGFAPIIASALNKYAVLQCNNIANTNHNLTFIGYNGIGDDWFELNSNTEIQVNTIYYAKCILKNQKLQLYLSTNGTTYEKVAETDYTYSIPEVYFNLGVVRMLGNSAPCTIYLEDCYVKVNDTTIWQGVIEEDVPFLTSNLINVTNTTRELLVHNSAISTKYESFSIGASDTYYVAPADGYVFVKGFNNSGTSYIVIYTNQPVYTEVQSVAERYYHHTLYLPVYKGQIFRVSYSGELISIKFVYLQGAIPQD